MLLFLCYFTIYVLVSSTKRSSSSRSTSKEAGPLQCKDYIVKQFKVLPYKQVNKIEGKVHLSSTFVSQPCITI